MEYSEILSVFGVTQGKVEAFILYSIVGIAVGTLFYYAWKYVLVGLFPMMVFYVFAHHQSADAIKPSTLSPKEEIVQVVPSKGTNNSYDKYMEECMSLTGKKGMCDELWKQNQD
jgi:hypothetical protein